MSNLMVYAALSVRVDDDLLDDVEDALDKVAPDNWRIISWRRTAKTRFLIYSTVESRDIVIDDELGMNITSLSILTRDMRDPRNEWLFPSRGTRSRPIVDVAAETLQKWLEQQWPDDPGPVDASPSDTEEDSPTEEPEAVSLTIPRRTRRRSSAPSGITSVQVEAEKPSDAVLRAFGITANEKGELSGGELPLTTFTGRSNKRADSS